MNTNLKPHAYDFCGNFHDAAYTDCATGEPYTEGVAPNKSVERTAGATKSTWRNDKSNSCSCA